MPAIRIGVIGDYDPCFPPQATLGPALRHAAAALSVEVSDDWIATETLLDPRQVAALAAFDGIFGGPGDVKSLDGAIAGIRYAREHGVPYFGTCAGFQYAVLEYARSVLGLVDATSAEFEPAASRLVLTPLTCQIAGQTMTVRICPHTRAHQLYGRDTATEEYFCHFGIAPEYREPLVAAGLTITGTDQDGEPRIFEAPAHPFYLASLFVPQTRSTPDRPHPLITGYLAACVQTGRGDR